MPERTLNLKTTRQAIEAMPARAVVMADALGCMTAGAFGDVLTARMKQREVAALVVDGAIRDRAGIEKVDLPVWAAGVAAPLPSQSLTFLDWQQPIACGGVAVFPDDTVVADDDGVVVIPASCLQEVLAQGPEVESLDAWVLSEIEAGRQLPGLYPPNAENMARYLASRT